MPNLPEETLQWNTALAGTHSEQNKTQDHRSWNQKWRSVLKWRGIVHLQVFVHLFQECLNTSFKLLSTKDCTSLWIGDQPPVLAVLRSVLVPLLRAFSGTGLRTCFGPQDAVSDQSPPAHYFRISGLPLVLFPLAPPTRQLNHLISTLSLTRSF